MVNETQCLRICKVANGTTDRPPQAATSNDEATTHFCFHCQTGTVEPRWFPGLICVGAASFQTGVAALPKASVRLIGVIR